MNIKDIVSAVRNCTFEELYRYALKNVVTPQSDWRRLLKLHEIDTVVDVGANKGQTYKRMRRLGFLGAVYSYEPNPDLFVLLKNCSAHDTNWHIRNIAASSRNSAASFYQTPCHSQGSLNVPRTHYTVVEVVGRRIDELEHAGRNLLLKIDTQGHDLSVLEGAAGLLDRVRLLTMECVLDGSYAGAPTPSQILAATDRLGFRLCKTESGWVSAATGKDSHVDLVFEKHKNATNANPRTEPRP